MWVPRLVSLIVSVIVLPALLLAEEAAAIPNWTAPPYWSPSEATATRGQSAERGEPRAIRAEALASVPTSPLPFIGITPCRIVDTRKASEPPGYGPPSLAAEVPRDFTLIGRCGIVGGAQAVSLNITVTNTAGTGFITIYPQGEARPLASTLNYTGGQTVANAAISALGPGGGITMVAAVSGTDLIIDTNGYYAGVFGTDNLFLGESAGNFTMTGRGNTAIGIRALQSNTSGVRNIALGFETLSMNTIGGFNTATGNQVLMSNVDGSFNTASGDQALFFNTSGSGNTAIGVQALTLNETGGLNVAIGSGALFFDVTGTHNTAVGANALGQSSGDYNIGLGYSAGFNLSSGSNNIDIGSFGVPDESGVIRIGTSGTHVKTFLAGVREVTSGADGLPVLIDPNGQLGIQSSSARVKREIEDIGEESVGLLRLRPVSFVYKTDDAGIRQYGLVADEVVQTFPELVVCDKEGRPETVRYHEMPALLLNELQKQEARIVQQAAEIEQLKTEVAALRKALIPN